VRPSTEMERQTSCMYTLSAEINRARAEVMREISAIAVQLFEERGYDCVTMKDVAYEAGVSVATLYRRYSNKENLVVWNPDEQAEMDALRSALQSGTSLVGAARQMADHLPDDAAEAVEATARIRLHLIRAHPSLQAAARMKSESRSSTHVWKRPAAMTTGRRWNVRPRRAVSLPPWTPGATPGSGARALCARTPLRRSTTRPVRPELRATSHQ
jgi:AcrR family transcriptional regulator